MIDLARHIEYLLLDRNDVCIQQLGTFHAQHVASRWVADENIFLPPYRTLTFEERTDPKDDTFLRTLAGKYKLTEQDAIIQCAEFVERIRQELEDNGAADLGSIGMFIRDRVDTPVL
ncbi:MAG: hypothetical protein HUK03_01850, partial [Bacteroidaceae bacterium]|nr:hypothetical protein [Bacteroidaceae bacterium]